MNTAPPKEDFRPRAHWDTNTSISRVFFYVRLAVDLQTNTIYRDLRRLFAGFSGKILDIGCGNSPYRHLLNTATCVYHGIDVPEAVRFGYHNRDSVYYDGRVIPFADDSFDALLCTEVLEHLPDPSGLIQEMHRVLRPGGFGAVTIPWSARFHYQPLDYHRYTPSMLDRIFSPFANRVISPRGTDLSSIASKIVVGYVRNLMRIYPSHQRDVWFAWLRIFVALIGIPILLCALLLGHCGILLRLGSVDDPLGYTVVIRK